MKPRPHVRRPVRQVRPGLQFATIPRRWPGGTVACLATGPSLTKADVDYIRGKVDGVIVINNAIDLAPWADVLYACDGKWWHWRYMDHSPLTPEQCATVRNYQGTRYAMREDARRWAAHGVQMIRKGPKQGLDPRPDSLAHGYNSGYQALGLAVKFGATRILLLGYDMRGGHFHGAHPDNTKPPFSLCIPIFATLVAPLAALGVEVINCTRKTALTCFPRVPLEVALPYEVASCA